MKDFTTQSGQTVLPYAYGCMQWGGTASGADAAEMFAACRNAGISHFDTAHAYTDGQSETLLGQLAAPEREALYVATKVAFDQGAGRDAIRASVDQSRTRLGMDRIDLLYMHRYDEDTPLEETFETLAQLQERGIIGQIGVSNYAAWQVMKAQAVAAGFGTRIDVIQPMYNLVKRQVEVEILPMADDQGITVCSYSPLGGGLLTGKYAQGDGGRLKADPMYAGRYAPAWMHEAAEGLAAIARDAGMAPATLAIAWIKAQAPQVHPILSARNAAQLAPSLAALEVTLDPDLHAAVTALAPTPAPATDRLEEA